MIVETTKKNGARQTTLPSAFFFFFQKTSVQTTLREVADHYQYYQKKAKKKNEQSRTVYIRHNDVSKSIYRKAPLSPAFPYEIFKKKKKKKKKHAYTPENYSTNKNKKRRGNNIGVHHLVSTNDTPLLPVFLCARLGRATSSSLAPPTPFVILMELPGPCMLRSLKKEWNKSHVYHLPLYLPIS